MRAFLPTSRYTRKGTRSRRNFATGHCRRETRSIECSSGDTSAIINERARSVAYTRIVDHRDESETGRVRINQRIPRPYGFPDSRTRKSYAKRRNDTTCHRARKPFRQLDRVALCSASPLVVPANLRTITSWQAARRAGGKKSVIRRVLAPKSQNHRSGNFSENKRARLTSGQFHEADAP